MSAMWEALIELLSRLRVARIIYPDELGVRTFCGKNPRGLNPGIHFVFPLLGHIAALDAVEQVYDARSQSLTTADHVAVVAGISIAYEVNDPVRAYYRVSDWDDSLVNESLGVVDRYVSEHTFADCLNSQSMTDAVRDGIRAIATERWGIKIRRVGRTDFARHRALRVMGIGEHEG